MLWKNIFCGREFFFLFSFFGKFILGYQARIYLTNFLKGKGYCGYAYNIYLFSPLLPSPLLSQDLGRFTLYIRYFARKKNVTNALLYVHNRVWFKHEFSSQLWEPINNNLLISLTNNKQNKQKINQNNLKDSIIKQTPPLPSPRKKDYKRKTRRLECPLGYRYFLPKNKRRAKGEWKGERLW